MRLNACHLKKKTTNQQSRALDNNTVVVIQKLPIGQLRATTTTTAPSPNTTTVNLVTTFSHILLPIYQFSANSYSINITIN